MGVIICHSEGGLHSLSALNIVSFELVAISLSY